MLWDMHQKVRLGASWIRLGFCPGLGGIALYEVTPKAPTRALLTLRSQPIQQTFKNVASFSPQVALTKAFQTRTWTRWTLGRSFPSSRSCWRTSRARERRARARWADRTTRAGPRPGSTRPGPARTCRSAATSSSISNLLLQHFDQLMREKEKKITISKIWNLKKSEPQKIQDLKNWHHLKFTNNEFFSLAGEESSISAHH